MQRALVVATVLLALIVALRADRAESRSAARDSLDAATSSTPIVVYSAGQGIAPLELRKVPMHDAIILEGALLSTPPEEHGLRALRLDGERRVDAYRNFNTAHNPAAAEAFDRFVRATPVDGLLVLGATGAIAPAGDLLERRRAALRAPFRRLGLDVDPAAGPSPSLCLVALKRREGWRVLGTALSNAEPVRLALHVATSPRDLDAAAPVVIDARVTVQALCDLAHETSSNAAVEPVSVAGVEAGTVIVRLGRAPDAERDAGKVRGRIAWPAVALGADARFTCGLLLREPHGRAPSSVPGEVVVDLLLDGTLVARERVSRTDQAFARPQPWRVLLRAAADGPGALELRVAQSPGQPPIELLAVQPLVSYHLRAEVVR